MTNLSLYNQNILSDEDFVANFVARHNVLETLLRWLKAIETDAGCHQILIGPRGMGKTSLLRRLAIEVNREPDLAARFVPLSFREEQYNVLTLGDFWRNCGEALAEWAESTGREDVASRLDAVLPTSAWAGNENSLEQFDAEMRGLKRRAVLLVDNLDLILNAFSDNDQWVLRRHLQARQGPIMIGAATQPLKESGNREAAFYQFFQPHYLEPLDQNETEGCMRALARRRNKHGEHVLEVLNKQPERLKTLHTLTGGNPRVLALIYRLLETAESDVAMADLEILLDQVTPYYKARIEEYQTSQQRAVIDAIALNWDPIKTGDLSGVTNIATTTLSPLLSKLRKDGLIENTDTSGAYGAHQVVERFLNIWYLMRHGTRRTKQKMRWLVGFLTSFYSSRELVAISDRAKASGVTTNWPAEYAAAFEQALAYRVLGEEDIGRRDTDEIGKTVNEARLLERQGLAEETFALGEADDLMHPQASLDELRVLFVNAKETAFRGRIARALIRKGYSLQKVGDRAAAIAAYDMIIARIDEAGEPALREQIIRALISKGNTLRGMGDHAAAISAYDLAFARFADVNEPEMSVQIAFALGFKGIALDEMGDRAAAIATYDLLVARFAEADEPKLRVRVATALLNKGATLREMDDYTAAIATYDVLVARFAEADEPKLRVRVATALLNKGRTLREMGEHTAAIAAFDILFTRFAEIDESELRVRVAAALLTKGRTLREMGEHTAAIAAFDVFLARFAEIDESELRVLVATALLNKGRTLREMDDYTAAIATYDVVVARFAEADEPELHVRVATALLAKGSLLREIGDHTAAIAAYNVLFTRFADTDQPILLREQFARAIISKGDTFEEMGDHAAAIAAYNVLLTRFADADEPELRGQVARALVSKGNTLEQMGDHAAAVVAYDLLLTRFADVSQSALLREQVTRALIGKGLALEQMGDRAAAIAVYDVVFARFADAKEPLLLEQVAWALNFKGNALGGIGDYKAAVATYDILVARFANADEIALRVRVAAALITKGLTLREMGEYKASVAAYDALLARFADAGEEALRVQVAVALSFKGKVLGEMGAVAVAISTYQRALDLFGGERVGSVAATVVDIRVQLANLLLDFRGEVARAEELYMAAVDDKPLLANGNLAWLYVFDDRLQDALHIRKSLETIPASGLALLDSAIEFTRDNFGLATNYLSSALDGKLRAGGMDFTDDFDRLLRLADRKGYGERLLAWFEETAFADRIAPIYVAFKAYVKGQKLLLDVNPEVRRPASVIYDRLDAPRRYRFENIPQKAKSRGRGRPRKA